MTTDLKIPRATETVPEQVVRVLSNAIIDGALEPGRRLTERELMELTGVSRTSVREAIRHLQQVGLVEQLATRGMQVAVLSEQDVDHIFEVRDALEPAAAELFVKRASDQDVIRLVGYIQPPEAPDDVRLASIYLFDELLVKGAGNPLLEQILTPLHARIHSLRRLSITNPGRGKASYLEYVALAQAIEERDAERAAQAAHRHIRAARDSALEALRRLSERADAVGS